MKPSHNPDADNSKARAEAAMERHAWPEALEAWMAWWSDDVTDPDDMNDRAVCHFHCGEKKVALTLGADNIPTYVLLSKHGDPVFRDPEL